MSSEYLDDAEIRRHVERARDVTVYYQVKGHR